MPPAPEPPISETHRGEAHKGDAEDVDTFANAPHTKVFKCMPKVWGWYVNDSDKVFMIRFIQHQVNNDAQKLAKQIDVLDQVTINLDVWKINIS